MALSICVYLSGLLLVCAGIRVLGPSGPLTVKLGGSLVLPCYTETLIPLEELEVDWMKTDSESIVHLFQDGEIKPEAQSQAYSGRASFFTKEIKHGNFSLLLTNVTTKDAGVYNCSVYRQDESGRTSVQIKEIGFSSMHIGVLVLCILAFAFPVCLSCHACKYLKREDKGRTALSVQCAVVVCPNVAMFLAFILWGVIEGFFTEAATCSALSLLRIVFLFWTAPYLSTFQVNVRRFIKHSAITLEFAVITTIAYLGLVLRFWQLYQENKDIVIMIVLGLLTLPLLLLYINIFYKAFTKINRGILNYSLAAFINLFRGWFVVFSYGTSRANLIIWILQCLLLSIIISLLWDFNRLRNKKKVVFVCMSALIAEVLYTALSVYFHNTVLELNKERVGLICVTVFLHILTLMLLLHVVAFKFDTISPRSGLKSVRTQQSQSDVGVYMFGTVALVCVNSIALAVELILKARNGERTVEDLRVILIPSECVFALCCLTLQAAKIYSRHRLLLSDALGICVCKRTSADSQSVERNHELVALQSTVAAPASQVSGS